MNSSGPSVDRLRPKLQLPALDGVRGLAIVLVLFFHLFPADTVPALAPVFRAGWLGVDLFFVLSGFLITRVLLELRESPRRYRAFYERRARRILPLYFVALTLALWVLPRIEPGAGFLELQPLWAWFYTFTFNVRVLLENGWPPSDVLNHFWSLAVEEQFYLLWPALVFLLPSGRLPHLCLAAVLLSSFGRIALVVAGLGWEAIYVSLPSHMDGLALGALGAYAYVFLPDRTTRPVALALLAISSTLLVASFVWWHGFPINRRVVQMTVPPVVAMATSSAIVASITGTERGVLGRSLATPVLRFFGRYSYGLYVYHPILDRVLASEVGSLTLRAPIPYFLLSASLSVIVSVISFHTLEARFLVRRDAAPGPRAVRPWPVVVSATIALAASGILGAAWLGRGGGRRVPSATASGEDRTRAALLVAPARLPLSLPLLGPEGTDGDGYPNRYVDRAGLRSLLHARMLTALDRDMTELQAAFEADPRKEYWPSDAGDAFASTEPELGAELDAWVATAPESFAPYFARGVHRASVVRALRGSGADKPPIDRAAAIVAVAAEAIADLDAALARRPQLVAAMRQEMRVARDTSDDGRREEMRRRATEVCPTCVQVRATYLHARTPRWGGSYEEMRAFVATVPLAANARLRVLGGYEDLDRAETLMLEQGADAAIDAIDRALEHGDDWEYFFERANIEERSSRPADALVDLNRADAVRPMTPAILAARARMEEGLERFPSAGRDLLTALRISPSDGDARRILPAVVRGVLDQARRLEQEGKHPEALDAAELGVDLAPFDRQAHGVFATIVVGDATTPERVERLRRRAVAQPGDFRTVQQLEYALSRENDFREIFAIWSRYIELHPDDGRAYLERADASSALGRSTESIADEVRACELGMSEGCERAQRGDPR